MRLGLKTRLKLISLLPISLLFSITSYYVYDSYGNYAKARLLQLKLDQNRYINEIIGNIARERGMSAMYLGDTTKNVLQSLNKQREIVDRKIAIYLNHAQNKWMKYSDNAERERLRANISEILSSAAKIKAMRPMIDEKKVAFEEMFSDAYTISQNKFINQLEQIANKEIDKEINELYSLYISMVNAKSATGTERGYISYILSKSTPLSSKDLNRWISIIGKADALNYERVQNKDLITKLDALFEKAQNRELFEDINSERTKIITFADSAEYEISSGIWFAMLSEKINIISEAENMLLGLMDKKASEIKIQSLQILIITFSIWMVAVILALLSYLLSSAITNNIKHLESVLKKVASDYVSEQKKIDLQTSEGTNMAYQLLEEIIEQTKKDKILAQEASQAKSMFLANMSHEIRTPLNGIVGFTELLKDSDLKEEQIEFVDIIEKSSENLLEIINNILDLSKIESNKLEIENIAFNPVLEFGNAVEIYAVRASEKNIDLGCFIDPNLEFDIKGDPTKLKEVIINLLSNAIKFTDNGGFVNVNIRKIESEASDKTRIRFEIQDSGIGVGSEQKSKIFEAFSQADISITRKYGGTGLGLTISSNFVELMGGKLDLISSIGEGTTFFFTLDFENLKTSDGGSKSTLNNLNALILSKTPKIKAQDEYLRKYLEYLGVSYAYFKSITDLGSLSENDRYYDIIFADYDYLEQNELSELAKLPQKIIILTKSNLIKKIDSFGFDIFRTLYEPLCYSKLKQTLENYITIIASGEIAKKRVQNRFEGDASKFRANALVAEDNIINQKLIKRTLEDLGISVTLANNGVEAFQKRKEENFDIIFMDVQMPLLGGVEATAEILKWENDYEKEHIPVIALTANSIKGDKERFISAGLDDYTAKPLVRAEIISILDKFLSNRINDKEATSL